MKAVVYDAGALVAAERNDRRFWADHRVRLELGIVPRVPSVVVAQVSRSSRQAELRRLLRGCDVVALDEVGAHRAGALLGKARTADAVDAALVSLAASVAADIVTSDVGDVGRLVEAARVKLRVMRP